MADEEKAINEGDDSQQEELSKLLDSALSGFAKPARTTDDELDSIMEAADAKAAQTAARDFQQMLQQMVAVQEEALRKAEESGEAVAPDEGEEAKAMMDAMRELMSCSGAIADASSPEEMFARLEQLGGPEGGMEPMMNMMMQAFISKDVLYPPLKEMYTAYPEFLVNKKGELDEETFNRYQKQYEIIGQVCAEFERTEEEGGEMVVREDGSSVDASPSSEHGPSPAIERIGRLLVELQTHGYPPAELTGSLPPGFAVDAATGAPRVEDAATAAEACTLM